MNLLKGILFLCFATFATTTISAHSYEGKYDKPDAMSELAQLVKAIDFNFERAEDVTIKVQFMLNANNEIVVLRTSDSSLDMKIKHSLNYKSLKSKDLEANKIYILPVSLKSNK